MKVIEQYAREFNEIHVECQERLSRILALDSLFRKIVNQDGYEDQTERLRVEIQFLAGVHQEQVARALTLQTLIKMMSS